MSFTRVNVGGWSVGDKLTSAQQNQLDADHANALDKSVAGDQLLGVVNFAVGAQIAANTPGAIVATAGQGIQSNSPAGIQSITPGGIQLAGGATDWVTFPAGSPRTRVLVHPMLPWQGQLQSGWSVGAIGLQGSAVATLQAIVLPPMHHGATLASLTISYRVGAAHSAIPVLPTLQVFRFQFGAFSSSGLGPASSPPTPANPAAWYAGGAAKSDWVFVPTVNIVIDSTNFFYYAQIVDESGPNAISGNQYDAIKATFTVPDMRFQ